MKHGTTGYAAGCRCDACRTAVREYQRAYYARIPVKHGTRDGYYKQGCRCDECQDARRKVRGQQPRVKLAERRAEYRAECVTRAEQIVADGRTLAAAAREIGVPDATLRLWVRTARQRPHSDP